MRGLTPSSLKAHPSLVPLFAFTVGGMGLAGWYTFRLASKNPDVCWDKKNNPYPWQKYHGKQYKFYSPTRDYSKEDFPPERPKID